MENGVVTNGETSSTRPRTPSLNSFSLTEYTTNPSPPSGSPKSKVRSVVPREFILPNGYPDVRILEFLVKVISNQLNTVSTTYPHLSSLRSRQGDPPHPSYQPK